MNPGVTQTRLSGSGGIHATGGNRLIQVDVTIADLDVETALGVRAGPGLEVDGRPLATEIRQRHQVALLALLALWE